MGLALTCQRLGQRDAVSLFAPFLTEGTEITLKHVAPLDEQTIRTRGRRFGTAAVVKAVVERV